MQKKSVSQEMGARVKDVVGLREGRRGMREERRGMREERRAMREERRGTREEGFETAEDSDWLYGSFFFVLLIFALSPGVLLTIPPTRGGIFMSGATSTMAAFVHAVLLVAILNFF
jgi:hypothetical protein